ncbi:MAG: TlpA family protein disulfide reductase, partial [Bdellovibrionales bacterium]|nr:TlpA family protein disulfide reductase [Bdellovibrionales bacterium]
MNTNLLSLILFFLISFNSYGSSPQDIIRKLGFQKTNSVPIDFTLQDLNGNTTTLSEYKGKWILINFWATWCGPCRMEMPTLESLHQEFKDENFVILGVSVDQSSKKRVSKFIKNNNITFKILHDQTSRVSGQYRASSIPSLYLISPDWKLVGIFRGGKSWESTYTMSQFRKLTSIKEVESGEVSDTVDFQLNLPVNLVPPTLDIKLLKPNAQDNNIVSQEFTLQVLVKWPAEGPRYMVKVPKIKFPDGVEIGNISSNTSSTAGRSILMYNYPIKLMTDGKFFLGPVTLAFSSQGAQEQFSRHPGIEVELEKSFFHNYQYYILLIIILVIIVLAVSYLIFKNKSKETSVVNTDLPNFEEEMS